MENYLNAIVVTKENQFLKYHSIKDTLQGVANFMAFVQKRLVTAKYVNFYNKRTKEFKFRQYVIENI